MIVTAMSAKGGVGKTTCLLSMACYMAGMGSRVLLLDLDPNQPLPRWDRKKQPMETAENNRGSVTVESADMDAISAVLAKHRKEKKFEIILIDLPGFANRESFKALARSDFVIIPAGCSMLDLNEAIKTIGDVREVIDAIEKHIPHKVLLTRLSPLSNRTQTETIDILNSKKIPYLETGMVERIAYKEAFFNGAPPHVRDPKIAAEMNALWREIYEAADSEDKDPMMVLALLAKAHTEGTLIAKKGSVNYGG